MIEEKILKILISYSAESKDLEQTHYALCDLFNVRGSDNYWSERCRLSEKIEDENPCDPDITADQIKAHKDYNLFLDANGQKDYL